MTEEKTYIITESQMNILKTTLQGIYKTKTVSKKRKATVEDDQWTCAGHIWEEPPTPCVPGKRINQKMKIMHNNKRVVVCKDCKLARDREKTKKRKLAKQEQNE